MHAAVLEVRHAAGHFAMQVCLLPALQYVECLVLSAASHYTALQSMSGNGHIMSLLTYMCSTVHLIINSYEQCTIYVTSERGGTAATGVVIHITCSFYCELFTYLLLCPSQTWSELLQPQYIAALSTDDVRLVQPLVVASEHISFNTCSVQGVCVGV
jgi:hypothetical protein